MGALVTLDLPDDSPVLTLPWIITFGPLDDDEDWEPVVCGPYERDHALSLAESVVADEELMAVVEPVLPHASVDQIKEEIATARLAAESDEDEYDEDEDEEGMEVAVDGEFDEHHDHDGHEDDGHDHDGHDHEEEGEYESVEPTPPPSPAEIRAGFARIGAKLSAGV